MEFYKFLIKKSYYMLGVEIVILRKIAKIIVRFDSRVLK